MREEKKTLNLVKVFYLTKIIWKKGKLQLQKKKDPLFYAFVFMISLYDSLAKIDVYTFWHVSLRYHK